MHHLLRYLEGKLPSFPMTWFLGTSLTLQCPLYLNIYFGIELAMRTEKHIVILIEITWTLQTNLARTSL